VSTLSVSLPLAALCFAYWNRNLSV
jgi:hypothetical protein